MSINISKQVSKPVSTQETSKSVLPKTGFKSSAKANAKSNAKSNTKSSASTYAPTRPATTKKSVAKVSKPKTRVQAKAKTIAKAPLSADQKASKVAKAKAARTPKAESSASMLGANKDKYNARASGVIKLHKMITPLELIKTFSLSESAYQMIDQTRQDIAQILQQADDRLVVIVGPCSIHDPQAGLAYANKLQPLLAKYQPDLCIVMRVYFEKPRTNIGWKGLINDPRLDDSYKINEGIAKARKLLVAINELGVPAAGEFLDNLVPQYLADLMSWGAIGARTTESQLHRELASGISCPIGFKNTTTGGVSQAIDAIMSASRPHTFLGINPTGKISIIETAGNPNLHVILRGGSTGTNFDEASVSHCCEQLANQGFCPQVMIDFSHANSLKDYRNQVKVLDSVCQQLTNPHNPLHSKQIMGVMIESNLVAGKQNLTPENKDQLTYGQSITDGCISWEETEVFLEKLAQAVQIRRQLLATVKA